MKITLPRRYLVLGLVVYLLALVATIPANLFTDLINRSLPGVTVNDLDGSIWNGRIGQLYVADSRLEGVAWHVQPWALLLGRLQLGLDYADSQNRVSLSVARGVTGKDQIRGLDGQLQLAWVQGLTPYTIPALKGTLQFNDVSLSLDDLIPEDASGEIRWRGATVDMGKPVPLGEILIQLSRAKGKVQAVLSETSGRLEGDARFSIAEDGNYRIEAKFKPTQKGADLSRHLALVMQRASDGSYVYQRKGRLPKR